MAYQIAEYARVSGVSKIVLGRTNHRIWLGQKKGTLTDQISEHIPDMDIYIILMADGKKNPTANVRIGLEEESEVL